MKVYSFFTKYITMPFADFILGISLNKHLKEWRKIQWYSKKQLSNLQREKLFKILSHSKKHIPYYRLIMKNIDLTNENDPYQALKKMPALTKNIIKENLPNNIIDHFGKIYQTEKTSGSSGQQGVFYLDKMSYSNTVAIQSLWWEWSGYSFGLPTILLGINPERGIIKHIKDFLFRTTYVNAFDLDDEKIRNLLRKIRKQKYFLMGYPSAIYHLAKFVENNNIKNVKLNAVVSFGDKLFEHYRKTIENAFKTKIYDTYGACEGTMIAAECDEKVYHIMSPHVIVEVLDDEGKDVSPGELGNIHVTHLDNYLMPLIRYKIGDLGILGNKKSSCGCGRSFPVLKKLIGRDTDIIYTNSGKPLVVHFFTGIFEHFEEIEQFQIIQKKSDPFIINYIPSKKFKKYIK